MTERIAVLGAGVMGAGIAQLGLSQGFEVLLYDVSVPALERARRAIAGGLASEAPLARLHTTSQLGDLTHLVAVIEAAPEELALKRELFRYLDEFLAPEVLLASATSTLPISALAQSARYPERIVGVHFLNPAPAVPIVEVVAGFHSGDDALARAQDLAVRLGKTPVRTLDRPGYVVHRIAHHYTGSALALLEEGVASVEAIDRVLVAAGFPLGPFAHMDRAGLTAIARLAETLYQGFAQSPRFRPSPLLARMLVAGRMGGSAGGFYAPGGESGAVAPRPGRALKLALVGDTASVAAHEGYWGDAGHDVVRIVPPMPLATVEQTLADREGVLEVGPAPLDMRLKRLAMLAKTLPAGAWVATTELGRTATELAADTGAPVLTLSDWSPLANAPVWELAASAQLSAATKERALMALGGMKGVVEVEDQVGLVFPRVLATMVNEAAWIVQERVAEPRDVDAAMRLALGVAQGPLEWAQAIGLHRVLGVLEGLTRELGDRYRPAPLLKRLALSGRPFLQ
ncbi:MAG TPA: 3-hydroxyacyl-CoA dehydrogenase NAD-binding domain-containing protein [Oscillatoriaceae cyanobacterium]